MCSLMLIFISSHVCRSVCTHEKFSSCAAIANSPIFMNGRCQARYRLRGLMVKNLSVIPRIRFRFPGLVIFDSVGLRLVSNVKNSAYLIFNTHTDAADEFFPL